MRVGRYGPAGWWIWGQRDRGTFSIAHTVSLPSTRNSKRPDTQAETQACRRKASPKTRLADGVRVLVVPRNGQIQLQAKCFLARTSPCPLTWNLNSQMNFELYDRFCHPILESMMGHVIRQPMADILPMHKVKTIRDLCALREVPIRSSIPSAASLQDMTMAQSWCRG